MQSQGLLEATIVQLEDLFAVPEEAPAEGWEWHIGDSPWTPLESIDQLRSLVSSVPDDCYITVQHCTREGVFTQAWRLNDRFDTECATTRGGRLATIGYQLAGAGLPVDLSHLVMASYSRANGALPDIDGLETVVTWSA